MLPNSFPCDGISNVRITPIKDSYALQHPETVWCTLEESIMSVWCEKKKLHLTLQPGGQYILYIFIALIAGWKWKNSFPDLPEKYSYYLYMQT